MLKHDRLATVIRRKKINSVQIIDISPSQIRDGLACKGSASEERLDGGDGNQFDWLRGRSWGGHPTVEWEVTLLKHPDSWVLTTRTIRTQWEENNHIRACPSIRVNNQL